MSNRLEKKREVLPLINNVISKLVAMSEHAAKLEYHDNDRASRDLKLAFINLRENELNILHRNILLIRDEINNKTYKPKNRKDERQIQKSGWFNGEQPLESSDD